MAEDKKIENAEVKDTNSKKIKNLISAVIILSGLFVGSLFVDVAQLVKGNGFSEKNLQKGELFEAGGKTWVAFDEPIVNVKVVSDETCEKCDPSEALVWLRRMVPTISAQKVDYASTEGNALKEQFAIKTLPAFIFSDSIARTNFYGQAQILFDKKDNLFSLKTQELGLTPGKYLDLPELKEDDAVLGKSDAKVKVYLFSDFQCPYCKMFWKTVRDTMKQYPEQVLVYKHLPLSFHAQAENAALSSACAQEQDKFWEYADKLYAAQSEWSNSTGTQKFKDYAKDLKLNAAQFGKCLDDKKYEEKIESDKNEANNFGISGTPAVFINSQFKNGVVSADDLKAAIEEELKK
ncbi:MAG: thioredoxin domain-containing protein [Parcubacteria group bacterium]